MSYSELTDEYRAAEAAGAEGESTAEKEDGGTMVFDLAKKLAAAANDGPELRSMRGGDDAELVADKARAVVRDTTPYKKGRAPADIYEKLKNSVREYREKTGRRLSCKGVGKSLEITAEGIAAVGAEPDKGLSAISILMDFLGGLNFVNEDANDFVDFYNRYIGFDLHGERLLGGLSADLPERLTLNAGKIDMNTKAATLRIFLRYPAGLKGGAESVYEALRPLADRYGLGVVKGGEL